MLWQVVQEASLFNFDYCFYLHTTLKHCPIDIADGEKLGVELGLLMLEGEGAWHWTWGRTRIQVELFWRSDFLPPASSSPSAKPNTTGLSLYYYNSIFYLCSLLDQSPSIWAVQTVFLFREFCLSLLKNQILHFYYQTYLKGGCTHSEEKRKKCGLFMFLDNLFFS